MRLYRLAFGEHVCSLFYYILMIHSVFFKTSQISLKSGHCAIFLLIAEMFVIMQVKLPAN